MSFFKKLFGSNQHDAANQKQASDSESAAAMHKPEEEINDEVVAAIMAAIVSAMGSSAANGLRIKSIRRTGMNAPVWCVAGRESYIASKL